MEPGFHRGDILFLTNPRSSDASARYATGDITVYKLPAGGIPIVHRVIETRSVDAPECALLESIGEAVPLTGTQGAEPEVLGAGSPSAASLPCRQLLLTKGDNNAQDDIALYGTLKWLERRHIIGKVQGCVNLDYRLPFSFTRTKGGLYEHGYSH